MTSLALVPVLLERTRLDAATGASPLAVCGRGSVAGWDGAVGRRRRFGPAVAVGSDAAAVDGGQAAQNTVVAVAAAAAVASATTGGSTSGPPVPLGRLGPRTLMLLLMRMRMLLSELVPDAL